MQQILDNYGTGINVVSVNMDEAQPPEEVQDAFNDAIRAREDEQRIVNEANAYRNGIVPQARGEGEGLLEQAEAYKTRVVKSAQGETSRFDQLLAEYNLMFLPLDQLLNRSQIGNSGDQSQSDRNMSSSGITDTFTRNTSRSRSREVLQ